MLPYEVISQDTAGASCNTKGKQCKLKPKRKTKRTSILEPQDGNCQFRATNHISPFYKKIYETIKSYVTHGLCMAHGLKQLYSGSSSLELGGRNGLKQTPSPAMSGCSLHLSETVE